MTYTYTTINHPVSGEAYAVEQDESGRLIRAAGPLVRTEDGVRDADGVLMDAEAIEVLLSNQTAEDAEADAAWLAVALGLAQWRRTEMADYDVLGGLAMLTGRESGAVQDANGDIQIGNWAHDLPASWGLPRLDGAVPCEAPDEVLVAMMEHAVEQGDAPYDATDRSTIRAWQVGDAIVVVDREWI